MRGYDGLDRLSGLPWFKLALRGGKVEIRLAHNQKIAGATPASATNMHGDCPLGIPGGPEQSPAVLVSVSVAERTPASLAQMARSIRPSWCPISTHQQPLPARGCAPITRVNP